MLFVALIFFALLSASSGVAGLRNSSNSPQVSYRATEAGPVPISNAGTRLGNVTYSYTDLGSSEVLSYFLPNGSIIFSPTYTPQGVGYAVSSDGGQTWAHQIPALGHSRIQPRMQYVGGRLFYWTSSPPGIKFQYSDDSGRTWSEPLQGGHFDPEVQDWLKLVSGRPVRSQLSNGAKEILYLSGPAFISTPIPLQPIGPEYQRILKSTDGGVTWTSTKGMPTLNPLLSGGRCATPTDNLAGQELIIWGDGIVLQNGTVVFGIRRCHHLSIALSDDEGDSWRIIDIPGASLTPFAVGDLTYLTNGNVLVSNPISLDNQGFMYATWVDERYILRLSKSKDSGLTWTSPLIISAPVAGTLMTYHPKVRHHPTEPGRAALSYYGSADGGKTWNAYVAETVRITDQNPSFSSVIVNSLSQPIQHNQFGAWDQGYGYPFWDLIEYLDVNYFPGSVNILGSYARRMCTAPSTYPDLYPAESCIDGWDYDSHAKATSQGLVVVVKNV